MGRRAGLVAAAVVALASLLVAGVAVGDPGTEKAQVDSRLGGLWDRAAEQQRQAGVLTGGLTAVGRQGGEPPGGPGAPASLRGRSPRAGGVRGGRRARARHRRCRPDPAPG